MHQMTERKNPRHRNAWTWFFCAILPSAAAAQLHADGPGQLLYSQPPAGFRHYHASLRPFRSIGIMPVVPNAQFPLTAIGSDGKVEVFAADGSAFLRIPAAVQDVRKIGVMSGSITALDGAGRLHAWGTTPPAWLPSDLAKDLATTSSISAAVTVSGALVAWSSFGQVAVGEITEPLTKVALGTNWALAVTESGETRVAGLGSAVPPSLPIATGVAAVSAAGSASACRAVVRRDDGSIQALHAPFSAAGPYSQAVVTSSKLLALNAAGKVHWWAPASTGGYAEEPTVLPGVYDDVAAPALSSSNVFHAICSADADRNGEPDVAQIRRGEMPDVNGDGVDDRVQDSSCLFDEDLNGMVDASECASIAGRHGKFAYLWYWMSPLNYRLGFFALDRVPPQAEAPRRAVLHYVSKHHGQYGVPPGGMPARYGIFLDPNGDGDPADAVSIGTWDITVEDDGRMVIDLGRIWIGPPGSVFFHGLTWNRPAGHTPALLPAQVPPPNSIDPFRVSRNRARAWGGAWEFATSPSTAIGEIRSIYSFEEWNVAGQMPAFALTWEDGLAADCDRDSLLDSMLVSAAGSPWWAPESDPDLDDNGVVDACEVDCDLDGIHDAAEILNGAADCNRDLMPDACAGTSIKVVQEGVPPSFLEPTYLTFRSLPAAVGQATIRIEVSADLGDLEEALLIRVGSGADQIVLEADGLDCPAEADHSDLKFDAATINSAIIGGMLEVRVGATPAVDPVDCPSGFVRVTLEYPTAANDCDSNGIPDGCEHGYFEDCDGNGVPDACELGDPALDLDGNGVLDACQFDCDRNGVPDASEIAQQPSLDCDASGYLDACEFMDCNDNGLHDPCEDLSPSEDCNRDGIVDRCQVLADCNNDGTPDACEPDCDANGLADVCELMSGGDSDADGILDACERLRGDLNLDGFVSSSDMPILLNYWGVVGPSIADLNRDGVVGPQDLSAMLANWGELHYGS